MTPHRGDPSDHEAIGAGWAEATIEDGKELQVLGKGTIKLTL